jgi:hypothetical protein
MIAFTCGALSFTAPHLAAGTHGHDRVGTTPLMLDVDATSSTVVAAKLRGVTKEGALAKFMSEITPAQLVDSLETRLSHVLTVATSFDDPAAVVVSPQQPWFIGPEILALWMKPQLVMHLHKKQAPLPSIECQSKCQQDAAFSESLRLAQLELTCWCSWVEESIHHLQDDTVPCLLMHTELRLKVENVRRAGHPLLRAMPDAVLRYVGQRAMSRKLAVLERAVASALVSAYEEWAMCDVPGHARSAV